MDTLWANSAGEIRVSGTRCWLVSQRGVRASCGHGVDDFRHPVLLVNQRVSFVCYRRISLPLPREVPMEFATLPEHYIEDVAEFILFTVQ